MTMQYEETDFVDFKANPIIFRPGFMLVKSGASFYGNGHDVQMNYLAAEKRFVNQRYSMTALPFTYSTDNITVSSYDAEKDSFNVKLSTLNFNTYQYSGAARSVKDYVFQMENSSLWLPVDTANRVATEGYLMDFGAVSDTVLRFNTFAPALGQYVYTEDGGNKSVFLTQYDHRTAGTGSDLNFTRQEDMGWNMKGLPWLVSNYRTDTIIWTGNFLRQMYIPHVFYRMDGAGSYVDEGDRILTVRSWDNGATASMGTAFLTQTATTADREEVIFLLPKYLYNKRAARPLVLMTARRPGNDQMVNEMVNSSDMLTVIPDSTVSKQVNYSYGRDGLKWIADTRVAQLYMLDSKRLSRISLLGAAPTEVDIPLGVYVPEDGQQTTLTFRLPEKEAFADYAYVWLIDYEQNRFTNLLEEEYELALRAGEYNHRFALRIGGFPKTDENGKRQYVVFAHDGTLHVRGLIAGDRIAVYSSTGQLVRTDVATNPAWSMPLFFQTGYVVRVDDQAYKVLNL